MRVTSWDEHSPDAGAYARSHACARAEPGLGIHTSTSTSIGTTTGDTGAAVLPCTRSVRPITGPDGTALVPKPNRQSANPGSTRTANQRKHHLQWVHRP